jgi:hypothetical protein
MKLYCGPLEVNVRREKPGAIGYANALACQVRIRLRFVACQIESKAVPFIFVGDDTSFFNP